jgi:hypothetical protein
MAVVDYFVSLGGNDTTGDNWTNAMTTIQGAIDLITPGIITDDITIHVEGGDITATPPVQITYTGNVKIEGIRMLGEDACLVIEPDSNAGATTWNDDNYRGNAAGVPYDPIYSPFVSTQTGTWDIKEDMRPVVIQGTFEIRDSGLIEICGIKFDGNSSDSKIEASNDSDVEFVYCHFYGENCMVKIVGKEGVLENCYFEENRIAIMCAGKSVIDLRGDNYIENAWQFGIYAMMDAAVQISPWYEHPLVHFTTEIKTTGGRQKYAAIKAIEKSMIKVWQDMDEYDIEIGHLKIYHESDKISANYYGVMLESMSLLSGDEKIDFLMKNTKGEDVEIPAAQQVVTDASSNVS